MLILLVNSRLADYRNLDVLANRKAFLMNEYETESSMKAT